MRHGGGRAGAGAAGEGLADAPLPDADPELVASHRGHELDVRPRREARVVLEVGAVLGDAGGVDVVDEEHQMRVADAGGVTVVGDAVVRDVEVERARPGERDRRAGRT